MNVTFAVYRSAEWVAGQRLACASNVPERMDVEIEIGQLSAEARAVLLKYSGGEYLPITLGLKTDEVYRPNRYAGVGSAGQFRLDAAEPTAEQIDAAILAASALIDAKRAQYIAAEEERRIEREAEAAQAEAKKAKVAEAKTLLAVDLAERDEFKSRLSLLSHFLSNIPLDAIRGTAKRLAGEGAAKILSELDDAADCWVVRNRDEDEDDSDE